MLVLLSASIWSEEICAWTPFRLTSRMVSACGRMSSTTNVVSDAPHECKFCMTKFSSRNSLFRHIHECPSVEGHTLSKANQMKRYTLRINFGYVKDIKVDGSQLDLYIKGDSREACNMIQKSLHISLRGMYTTKLADFESTFQVVSVTQSSVASQRHRSLTQEDGCAARNDVMTISYSFLDDRNFAEKIPSLLIDMNSLLQREANTIDVRVSNISLLDSPKFHAENSCTQYIYHYLMPIWWLKDSDVVAEWLLKSDDITSPIFGSGATPSCLKRLKQILKSSESMTIPNRRVRRKNSNNLDDAPPAGRIIEKIGIRKMGTMSNKERRCQHNFADLRLQGDASPNQEPVWRIIDRSRIVGISRIPDNDEVNLVLEFRGDAFLPQQVRRIVGTALACTNGWLPLNTFDTATRPDMVLETVLAPAGRLYLYDVRFHFDENCVDRQTHEKSDITQGNWIIPKLFRNLSMQNRFDKEAEWIEEVKNIISPRITSQMSQNVSCSIKSDDERVIQTDDAPDIYLDTLTMLRNIATFGWPKTSSARSKLIKNIDVPAEMGANHLNVGSFTVVNTNIFQLSPNQSLPLGNRLFPDLVYNVFQLEAKLSKYDIKNASGMNSVKRKPSTHCAVNFNANFKPHVDSGIGLGQSSSMIVGMGDYIGGEIFVEGEAYHIRYEPLEFDGWTQRHWTGSYTGERFSLVWFTPDTTTVICGNKDVASPLQVVISKNQMKRQKRQEEIANFRKSKAIKAMNMKKDEDNAQGRDLEPGQKRQREKAQLGEGKRRRDEEWAKTMLSAPSRFRITIDCSFDNRMTYKEKNSLARQIQFCYAANKASKNSVLASALNLSQETKLLLGKSEGFPDRWKDRGFDCTNNVDILNVYPDKSKLVYLTSDSSTTIHHLEDDKIYIIGGIVDRNRLKNATMNKATELGLATARLPLDEHLKMSGTQVLTVNHVFEILLKFREHNDWKKAFLEVIPDRKVFQNN